MGRETIAVARWGGAVEEVKALLEAREIILRGAIKARIPRSGITRIAVEDGDLVLWCQDGPLVLELGATEVAKWHEALLKPPPTLAAKLGIGPDRQGYLIGKPDDHELEAALSCAVAASPGEAHVLLAMTLCAADLAAALEVAKAHPRHFLWCIYEKGKTASFGDTAVRSFMREHGYVDSKSCAVSDRLTATRYGAKNDPVGAGS